jgi:hypothetical protein
MALVVLRDEEDLVGGFGRSCSASDPSPPATQPDEDRDAALEEGVAAANR